MNPQATPTAPPKAQLLNIDPFGLDVHEALIGFPDLPADKYEALKLSIAENGILEPLAAEEDGDMMYIIAGRNRLKIAIELKFATVPVFVRPAMSGDQVLDYAIEEALVGRQLSRSGIALLIFDKHPQLAGNRLGRPKKNVRSTDNSDSTQANVSYRTLSERYQVPIDYFTILVNLRRETDDEEWAKIRDAVFNEETPLTRIIAGQGGRGATIGKGRRDANYLSLSANGKASGLMPKALTSLQLGFGKWNQLDLAARAVLKTQWEQMLAVLPEDLRQ